MLSRNFGRHTPNIRTRARQCLGRSNGNPREHCWILHVRKNAALIISRVNEVPNSHNRLLLQWQHQASSPLPNLRKNPASNTVCSFRHTPICRQRYYSVLCERTCFGGASAKEIAYWGKFNLWNVWHGKRYMEECFDSSICHNANSACMDVLTTIYTFI